MTVKPIRNDDDLNKAFRRLEKIFQAEAGTAQADERDVLVTLVEACANRYHDFGPADPVEAIKLHERLLQMPEAPVGFMSMVDSIVRQAEIHLQRLHARRRGRAD